MATVVMSPHASHTPGPLFTVDLDTAPAATAQSVVDLTTDQDSCCRIPYIFSCCVGEEADSRYEERHFYRRQENGQLHGVEKEGTLVPKKYTYLHDKHDKEKGKLLNNDPRSIVAFKCCWIFIGALPYAAATILSNIVDTIVKVSNTSYKAITQFVKDLQEKSCCEAFGNFLYEIVVENGSHLLTCIWRVVRAPFFALAIMFCTFLAIYDPYLAKDKIGEIEHIWHDKAPPMQAHKQMKKRTLEEQCAELPSVFYLATCFQPVGHMSKAVIDPKYSYPILPHEGA